MEVRGSPVFALTRFAEGKLSSVDGSKPRSAAVFCGLAAKEIVGWDPESGQFNEKVRMNGHTGWVRSLATSGKWLFSCGCNTLRQWDASYAVPRETRSAALFKGDISAIAASPGRVYTAGADGSLRAWRISKASGELSAAGARERAHEGRATSLVCSGGLVFSTSYDGSIKGWDAESLELVLEAKAAHGGERVQCAALGADGLLYTGGDDHLVRRWEPRLLAPAPGGGLAVHGASVRVLAAGPCECLVSGDAAGEVAVWSL